MEKRIVKRSWVSEGEYKTFKNLISRCANKDFVEFVKQNFTSCFPNEYFEKFGWIKLRFDDLKYDFENGKDPLQNKNTYSHFYDEGEDILDLSDWNLNISSHSKYEKETIPSNKNKFSPNNRKVSQKEILVDSDLNKDITVIINDFSEIVLAMKCLLWSFDNKPQTVKKLFSHIKIKDGDIHRKIEQSDYAVTNTIIKKAPNEKLLVVEKVMTDDKEAFLYKNPTNRRLGYFYNGKLWTLTELSQKFKIKETTLYNRLKRMNVESALQKEV